MRVLIFSVLLLATAAITMSMKVTYWGTEAEREAIISEALSEAKLSETLREQATQASINSNKPITASMKLARGFKKASPRVQKMGKARIFMEDAVKRAERKLFELKKTTEAQSMSAEARAEEIATELFHRPGRFLKEDELAKIYLESGCIFERSEADIICELPSTNEFRTIDGTCNNPYNITLGASETDFRRLIPGQYEDGISVLDGTLQFLSVPENAADLSQVFRIGPFQPPHPSARLVSQQIIRDRDINEIPISHILMQWGQFLDHDLDLGPELEEECEGCKLTEICNNIAVPDLDPVFGIGTPRNGDCLPFRRSLPSCFTDRPLSFSPREQINALTSFIDGSMIYGSTSEAEEILRLYQDGLLRAGPPLGPGQKESLPTILFLEQQGVPNVREIVACPTELGNDCFVCGDIRCNEQISLTIMHTIWLREHNRLARELQRINPHWSDERLFQEARAIVGAEIQKITYLDYLPIVLGRSVFNQVIEPFREYNPAIDPSVPNSFATAAYRYGHSLVRPEFDRLDAQYNPLDIGPLPLRDAFFNPAALAASGGTDSILLGNVNTSARRVDESLSSPLTSQLFENEPGTGMDLAALNIQRSRDHGLPFYVTFRRFCQTVFPALQFNEIENDLTFIKLLQVYGSLETVELWVGGLSEERLPESLLGPTFACLFGLTFKNVRDGDRFYFESPSSTFTPSQITQIEQSSLSSVLCNNGDDIRTIQLNAFYTDQTRLNCASVPSIDLGAWRENACYARIDPTNTGGLVVAFSGVATPPIILETFTNEDVPECLAFVCPTGIAPSFLVSFVNIVDFSQCVVQPNLGLPPSGASSPAFYLANIPSTAITPANGLYTSLKSCQKSPTPAFTFSSCLPSLSAQSSEQCNPQNPGCAYGLPPGLKEQLDKHNALDYATTFEAGDAVKENESIESLYAGQQELLHELENELKQLSQ